MTTLATLKPTAAQKPTNIPQVQQRRAKLSQSPPFTVLLQLRSLGQVGEGVRLFASGN